MADEVKLEVIKKTQDLLGKYFKRPPLTEKLLKKPPFRFIHDIISSVIRETGFLEGLFTEQELNSDNVKDKESKVAYLTKLIEVVKLATGLNLAVRASKIISGQEATKTNQLLQAIGKALDKKISSKEAIEKYKKNIEGKKSKSSENESSRKKNKSGSQSKSRGEDVAEVSKSSATEVGKKTETSNIVNEKNNKNKRTEEHRKREENTGLLREEKDHAAKAEVSEPLEVAPHNGGPEIHPQADAALQENEENKQQQQKPKESSRNRQSTAPIRREKTAVQSSSTISRQKEHQQDSNSANRVPSSKPQQQQPKSKTAEDKKSAAPRRSSRTAIKAERKLSEELAPNSGSSLSSSRTAKEDKTGKEENANQVASAESIKSMTTSGQIDDVQPPVSATMTGSLMRQGEAPAGVTQQISRPRSSLRPPSARPASARPAAPRLRSKTELLLNEQGFAQGGGVSVIVENFDTKEDEEEEDKDDEEDEKDDDEHMIVLETSTGNEKANASLGNGATDGMELQLQQHGHLVAQILETQRELTNSQSVDLFSKKVEIEWEAGSRRGREVVVKEIDKLRGTIQSLTKATNPLGKLLDFVQEDVEMMQKELRDWQRQNQELSQELQLEQKRTEQSMEPMRTSLREITNNIKHQLDKISQVKYNVMKNDDKVQRMLNGN